MLTNQEILDEFHEYLLKGNVQKAYRSIFDVLGILKTNLSKNPNNSITGNMYHGYLDMTYFPIFTEILKKHLLKVAVVFNYMEFRFEIWLSANNKKVQKKYWDIFKEKKWNKYSLMESILNEDSIIEYPVQTKYDFNDTKNLVKDIEIKVSGFINDIENYLITLK